MSIFGILSAILGVVSLILVIHEKYDDGLIGRIFLAGVITASVVVVVSEIQSGPIYSVSNEILLMMMCVTGFALRHAYRFLRWAHGGFFGWGNNKVES